jgi:hypothetical protein
MSVSLCGLMELATEASAMKKQLVRHLRSTQAGARRNQNTHLKPMRGYEMTYLPAFAWYMCLLQDTARPFLRPGLLPFKQSLRALSVSLCTVCCNLCLLLP